MNEGADINATNNDGSTALAMASESGNLGVVMLLLEKRANVNAKDRDGYTALWIATDNGNNALVNLLKTYGAK